MKIKINLLLALALLIALQGYGEKDTMEAQPGTMPIDLLESLTTSTKSLLQEETENAFIPLISPLSPNASSLGKYGEHPVSMASGTPEISIQIYEIKSSKLSLPISLSYYASGIKVDEIASWAGLGWSLNAGGVVTRAVSGFPDEDYNGFYTWENRIRDSNSSGFSPSNDPSHPYGNADFVFLDNALSGHFDTEPDKFSYNVAGMAGSFFISNDTVRTIPYSPIKIIAKLNSSIDNKQISIISTDGTIYRFGTSLDNEEAFEITRQTTPTGPRYNVSSWYLTEIISADYSDTIFFKYETHSLYCGTYIPQQIGYFYDFEYGQGVDASELSHYNGEINGGAGDQRYSFMCNNGRILKEIIFAGGKVVFHSSDREDVLNRKLDFIEIFSNENTSTPIKRFNLDHSYFIAEEIGYREVTHTPQLIKKRLRLDNVTEEGKPPYIFEYSPIALPPINSFRQDYWGFFNNATENESLIPETTFGSIVLGDADRSLNALVITAGMLEKITYPTGGLTQFIFEANEIMGGVRIKQVITDDGSGNVKTKNYEYSVGIGCSSPPEGSITLYNEGIPLGDLLISYSYYKCFTLSNPPIISSAITYEYVTVKEGGPGIYNGKSVYKYSCYPDEIFYGNDSGNYTFAHEYNSLYYIMDNSLGRGKLEEETHFDSFGNKLKRIVNHYTSSGNYLSTDLIGLKVNNWTIFLGSRIEYTTVNPYYQNQTNYMQTHTFPYNQWIYLARSETYDYDQIDDSKVVITNIDYVYANEKHAQLTKETTTGSGGNTIEKRYYYPQDYSSVQNFSTLINNHIIAKPIDVRSYSNTQLTSGIQTKYNDYGQPIDVYGAEIGTGVTDIDFISSNPYQFNHKVNYEYNAVHNLIEVAPDNNVHTYYAWAYNNQYPIAKIESSTNTAISVTVDDNSLSKSDQVNSINSDIAYLKSLLSGFVNNPDYMVTLYTYAPLLGLTSQTDPNGVTTYYEYDSFGRLKNVRDNDQNILGRNYYHYYWDTSSDITP